MRKNCESCFTSSQSLDKGQCGFGNTIAFGEPFRSVPRSAIYCVKQCVIHQCHYHDARRWRRRDIVEIVQALLHVLGPPARFSAQGPSLPALSPAQTSKFIADSKKRRCKCSATDNEFSGFVSNILSYDENEN